MPIRKLLLFSNSPRTTRYFRSLAEAIRDPEVITRRVGLRRGGDPLPPDRLAAVIEYGMRRKRAREHYGPLRLQAFEGLYGAAARGHYADALHWIGLHRPDAVGVWGGNALDVRAVREAAARSGIPCLLFEEGFLPRTTQMDWEGVNVESSVPRDPEFFRRRAAEAEDALPDRLTQRKPKRAKRGLEPVALPDRYVFVPFQVKLDSQVLLHSPWIDGMPTLFRTMVDARSRLGEGAPALVFKEHPSCPERYPELHRAAAETEGVLFANGNVTEALIRGALGVVTLNSTVGLEALLLDRPVLALGNAVYEVPGVAASARSVEGVSAWLGQVADGSPPPAPLRVPFLRYLAEEAVVPDSHREPGPAHFAAVAERLRTRGPGAGAPAD